MIKLRVNAMPAPQGSKSAFALRKGGKLTGRVVLVDDNKDSLAVWRAAVRAEALAAQIRLGHMTTSEPVAATIVFILPRPLAHYGTGANRGKLKASAPRWPAGHRMDLDKLARSTLDALTQAGVWADDGQVYELGLAKVYAASPAERPGAAIEITWGGE